MPGRIGPVRAGPVVPATRPRRGGAPDKAVARLRRDGSNVEVIGYNQASADLVDRFALHDRTGFEPGVVPH